MDGGDHSVNGQHLGPNSGNSDKTQMSVAEFKKIELMEEVRWGSNG